MGDNNQNNKGSKQRKHTSVLESLKDVGENTGKSLKRDLLEESSKDMLRQILGERRKKKASTEIKVGEDVNIQELVSGEHEKNKKEKKKTAQERKLRKELEQRETKKKKELEERLSALQQEVVQLAKSTEELGENTKIAAMQAPAEPGPYHITYFEKLLGFIKSFVKKIENANIWMKSMNKRAQKKNFWAKYEKHGSKFLLSPDHYLTRSAG